MFFANVGVGQSKITFITPQTLVYNKTNNLPEYFVSNTCTVPPTANYVDQETLGTIYNSNLAPIIPGNYRVTLSFNSGTCLTAPNATINFTISPMPLTVTASAYDKVYDGNPTANVTLSDNRISGDDLSFLFTPARFNNKNVGLAKEVTVSGISITGTDAGNYTLTNVTAITNANITVKSLTVSATANNKVYDGNRTAVVGTLTSNKLGLDVIDIANTTATFANKNVGLAKEVTVSGITITGTDAGNYTLTNVTAITNADITVKSLTISATANNKIYDGNTTANATLTYNKISGDDVTVNKTATFNNKNIGIGKAVTVSGISLTGTDAGNYTITNTTAAGTASITIRNLTISATVSDKVYDGNTTAIASLTDNRLTGDDLTVNKTGVTFNNKNAGSSKTVNIIGITLAGTDAGNYTITNATATGTASITAKSLTISATAANKEYDGNMNATVVFSDNRISGDVLTVNKNGATFNNKNVGVGKTVTINGINLTGTDAGNYNLISSTATGIASITAKNLTVSAIAKNKSYDGSKKADVTLSENKIIGDVISSTYILAEFDTKDVGNNKTVTVTGISIAGIDAGNYSLTNTTATASANITGSPIPFAVPNAFTPNGDGKNDKFKIIFNNTTGVTLRLQIYNRNGILMFNTSDISEEWDGRYKDVMQDMGIYFVKYRIEIAGGKIYEDTPRLYLLK